MRLDRFYSLFAKIQLHTSYRCIVHYRNLLSGSCLKRYFSHRPSLLANMTIQVCLTVACSILTANWIFNRIEYSRVSRLKLKPSNFRPMKPSLLEERSSYFAHKIVLQKIGRCHSSFTIQSLSNRMICKIMMY